MGLLEVIVLQLLYSTAWNYC